MDSLLIILLSLSVVLIGYTFVGYPVLMKLLSSLRPRKIDLVNTKPKTCTVVISLFNASKQIESRLRNLHAMDTKGVSFEILLINDGPDEEIKRISESLKDTLPHRLIFKPARTGKADSLNIAISKCTSEIILLADARQSFAPDVLQKLMSHFKDPDIGAVSGLLEIAQSTSGTGEGVGAYWKLERALRTWEAKLDSCIGCTGAIYAIRRELYSPIPPDTLVDDVVIPMQIASRGHRVFYDPEARAFDSQSLEPEIEERRKTRTLAGNFQFLFRYPEWLLPWKNRLWWQLVSHKYLRIIAPFFLITAFVSNLLLCHLPLFRATMGVQAIICVLAWIGICFPRITSRFISVPAAFVFLNLMSLKGFGAYLSGRYQGGRW